MPNTMNRRAGSCDACEVLMINGKRCHETGCPDAWQDYDVECAWCGTAFRPEERWQKFCDDSCYRAYNNLPDDEDGN